MSAIGFSSGWATLVWESGGGDPIDTVMYEVKHIQERYSQT